MSMPSRTDSFPFLHFITIFLLSLILIGLSSQSKLNFLSNPVNYIAAPLRLPLFQLRYKVNSNFSSIKQFSYQGRLIKDLKRQNANLLVVGQKVKALEAENLALRSTIKSPPTTSAPLLPVKIISLSRFAYINQGSKAGIKPGLPLVVDNTLVGIVTNVTNYISQIRLITDKDTDLPAITSSAVTGQINYQNTTLHLTQVLQKDSLIPEEPIFTKGSELIPAGLLIGTIASIEPNKTNVYQSATITPTITILDQQTVFVILD